MRAAVVAAVLLLTLVLLGPGTADGAVTVRYVLPAGFVGPNGESLATPVGLGTCPLGGCITDEHVVVGNPIVVIDEPLDRLTVRFFDDFNNDRVPVTVCMDGTPDGLCTSTTFGPYCHGFILFVQPPPAETVVYAHLFDLSDDMGACGGTKGFATIQWADT